MTLTPCNPSGACDGRRGDRGDREPRSAATGADGPVPAGSERCVLLNHVEKRLEAPRKSGVRTARRMPVHADGEWVGTTPSHRPRIGLTTVERYVRTGYSEEIWECEVRAADLDDRIDQFLGGRDGQRRARAPRGREVKTAAHNSSSSEYRTSEFIKGT